MALSKENPTWYNKYLYDKKVPDWYRPIIEKAGYKTQEGTFREDTPEEVNEKLTSPDFSKEQAANMVFKNIKLPPVGAGYKKDQIVPYSYYNAPIVSEGPFRGNSRKYGDINENSKRQIISLIKEMGQGMGLTKDDVAYVLAIAHVESGFNPDAAAGTTSAHGLGQFINRTGEANGLTDSNRWDVQEQIRALIDHYNENKERAKSKGSIDYIYAYHHDGPSLKYGGLDIARSKVRPLYEMYKGAV